MWDHANEKLKWGNVKVIEAEKAKKSRGLGVTWLNHVNRKVTRDVDGAWKEEDYKPRVPKNEGNA